MKAQEKSEYLSTGFTYENFAVNGIVAMGLVVE